jgi:hypothetical protein
LQQRERYFGDLHRRPATALTIDGCSLVKAQLGNNARRSLSLIHQLETISNDRKTLTKQDSRLGVSLSEGTTHDKSPA